MTEAQLIAKIYEAAESKAHLEEMIYLRDERLGILGCYAGMVATEEQIGIVDAQLFPNQKPHQG